MEFEKNFSACLGKLVSDMTISERKVQPPAVSRRQLVNANEARASNNVQKFSPECFDCTPKAFGHFDFGLVSKDAMRFGYIG